MVLREHSDEDFYIRIDGKWILVDRQLLSSHPGGSAMTTYKNLDATTVLYVYLCEFKVVTSIVIYHLLFVEADDGILTTI